MKINFTKAEYRLLVEMLTVADWVMHGKYADTQNSDYQKLRNKIFSFYKEFDAKNLIDTGFKKDEFFETDELMNYVHQNFMDSYEEDVFWDELIHKLGLRDVINEIGVDKYNDMEMIERASKVEDVKESYATEFAQHGIKNVIIKLSTEK
jgi:hypothetical protein